MPYLDPEKKRESDRRSQQRRMQDPEYAAKRRAWHRAYWHVRKQRMPSRRKADAVVATLPSWLTGGKG